MLHLSVDSLDEPSACRRLLGMAGTFYYKLGRAIIAYQGYRSLPRRRRGSLVNDQEPTAANAHSQV
jgi:hypothetical protein